MAILGFYVSILNMGMIDDFFIYFRWPLSLFFKLGDLGGLGSKILIPRALVTAMKSLQPITARY